MLLGAERMSMHSTSKGETGATSAQVSPSVFAIFGGRLLYGQERVIIEVLKALNGLVTVCSDHLSLMTPP